MVGSRKAYFGLLLTAVIILIYFIASALEIAPEFERVRFLGKKRLDRGDNLTWLGMEIAPLSKGIRKEFDIPRRIKGIFILDEGRGPAKSHGLKTGDVIRSINRKRVRDRRSFIKVAESVKFYDGILLDVYRDGKNLYVSIPFEYQYGPLVGPNRGHWQLGSPVWRQAFSYGTIIKR